MYISKDDMEIFTKSMEVCMCLQVSFEQNGALSRGSFGQGESLVACLTVSVSVCLSVYLSLPVCLSMLRA